MFDPLERVRMILTNCNYFNRMGSDLNGLPMRCKENITDFFVHAITYEQT